MDAERLHKIVNEIIKNAPEEAKDGCYGPWATVEEVQHVVYIHRCCRDSALIAHIYEKLHALGIETSKILILPEW